jgi:Glycosyl hydrolases family 15
LAGDAKSLAPSRLAPRRVFTWVIPVVETGVYLVVSTQERERLIGLANDLGLLAEEYDVARRRQVGNFPQAFSHLTLILAARAISTAEAEATAEAKAELAAV